MGTIILYDDSLNINTSKADIAVAVSKGEFLYEKIQQLAAEIQLKMSSKIPGCYNSLHIFCNCSEWGLELGSGVHEANITSIFLPLKYKIGNIYILGCNAATIFKSANSGINMCKKLAQATYACVTASNGYNFETGTYSEPRKNTDWTGSVATWNQLGKLILLREYNESGVLIRTIDHPGQLLMHNFLMRCKRTTRNRKTFSSSVKYVFRNYSLSGEHSFLHKANSFFAKHLHISGNTADKAA